jgi:hypothetical protein
MHRYTQEQIQFIREQAKGKQVDEIHQLFIEEFKVNVTIKSIKGIMYRHGIKNGMQGFSTRFNKGQSPWNKGIKGVNFGGEETQFKKGNLPPSYLPVGSESVHEDYVWVKVSDPNKWVKKHKYIWEQAHGPIPEGYVIRFADGNKMNVSLDNLFITPRRVCTSVVKRGIESDDPEINISTHNLAELDLVIKDFKKRIDG